MQTISSRAVVLGLCMVGTVVWGAASAAPATAPSATQDGFWTWQDFGARQYLTGDWGGLRPRLNADGVSLNVHYIGEFAQALAGGKSRGHGRAMQNQISYSANFDLGKLVNWSGASIHVILNTRFGNTLQKRVGNAISTQETYGGGQITRLTELSYEQKLLGGRVDTIVGFFPVGDYYGALPVSFDFINGALLGNPPSLPFNSGWENYPAGQLGGRVKVSITPSVYVQAGVFESNPTLFDADHGFRVDTTGATGAYFPVELGYTPSFQVGAAQLPGIYKLGAYYDTSAVHENAAGVAINDRGRQGGYLQFQQMLWNFADQPGRGLIFFGEEILTNTATASFWRSTSAAGFIAQGPFASRPKDFLALGWSRIGLNSLTREGFAHENAIHGVGLTSNLPIAEDDFELGYSFQASAWLQLHPFVQYLLDPGALFNERTHNAWLYGFQVQMSL